MLALHGLHRVCSSCRFIPSCSPFPAGSVRAYSSTTDYEKPDVRKLAEMAQINVTDEEVRQSCVRDADGNTCNMFVVLTPSIACLAILQTRSCGVQVEAWTPQLNKVTEFFAQLQAIDLTDVPPTLRVQAEGKSDLRKDEVVEHPAAERLLKSMPDTDGQFVKVPRIQSES